MPFIIIYLFDLQMLQTLDDILVNSIIESLTLLMAICNWYHTLYRYKFINKEMVILYNNEIYIYNLLLNQRQIDSIDIFIKSEITMYNQISKYCKLNGI